MSCPRCEENSTKTQVNVIDLSYIIEKAREHEDLVVGNLSVVYYAKRFHLQTTLTYSVDGEKQKETVEFGTVQ